MKRPRPGQLVAGPRAGQTSKVLRVRHFGTIDVEVVRGPGVGSRLRVSGLLFPARRVVSP